MQENEGEKIPRKVWVSSNKNKQKKKKERGYNHDEVLVSALKEKN